jgi:membrane protease YdiL (CAAX protease family)
MRKISVGHALAIFAVFTAYFFLLLVARYPSLEAHFDWNPALHWFVTGYFLFVPIFAYAVIAVRLEGCTTLPMISEGLSIRPMSAGDWKYAASGLALVFALTGGIFGASFLLNAYLGVRELSTTPWFVELSPLRGMERLLLLVWLGMFFFNIVGEEIMWRGYVQRRISVRYGWLLCSLLWWLFHLPFGGDLMIMLIPIVFIVPYVFHKTNSTLACVFIHGVYNGPLFAAIALGAIK